MKNLFIIFFLSLLSFLSNATTCIWTGNVSNSWYDKTNWDCNIVPTSSDIAQFSASYSKKCVIDRNVIIAGITVNAGFNETIEQLAGANLYVGSSGIILNSGTLKLNADLVVWGDILFNGGVFEAISGTVNRDPIISFNDAIEIVASDKFSFVKEQIVLISVSDESLIDALSVEQVNETDVYYDGWNRKIQEIQRQASSSKKDIVTIHEYDAYGRELKTYLPYASNEIYGSFKDISSSNPQNAFVQQRNFYTSVNTDPLIPKTIIPSTGLPATYSESLNEPVVDGSIIEAGSFGDTWKVMPDGTGKTVKTKYRFNESDEVRYWNYDFVTSAASALKPNSTTQAFHFPNSLYVTEVTDENYGSATNGSKVIQYKDLSGKLLLSKTEVSTGVFAETYYIYDKFGQLRYVLPPNASALLSTISYGFGYNDAFAKLNLFCFKYDASKRVSEKRTPGADPVKIIYDELDRPVLTQDGVQAQSSKWSFTKYDALGRVVLTGIITDSRSISTIQNELLSYSKHFEKKISGTSILGYSNTTFPTAIVENDVKSVNYYDSYDINSDNINDFNYANAQLGSNEPVPFSRILGTATVNRTRNLENNLWLTSANFFDKNGRLIQVQSNNHYFLSSNPGSTLLTDIQTNVLDFSGKVLQVRHVHSATSSTSYTVNKRFKYDHVGRLKNTYFQLNTMPEIMLSSCNYNELGQLIEKNLHSEDNGNTFLQSIDFRYNIRGWLSSINNSLLSNDMASSKTNDDSNDLWGANLLYSETFGSPQYNGNISAVKWKTNNPTYSTTSEKAFAYSYDKLNRLISSGFAENNSSWAIYNKYSEVINYDLNGNVSGINRKANSSSNLDALTLTFSGNQLIKTEDAGDKLNGFVDYNNVNVPIEYTYDKNGNFLTDLNKGITGIQYNYLNLPEQININGQTVTYRYSASGAKLKKTSGSTVTNYVGDFVYQNNQLSYINTEEGRIIPNGSGFIYQYCLRDHLGNLRVAFDKDPATNLARVIQENHYYPFGARLDFGLNSDNYNKFNGSLEQTETKLDDFGARLYDPYLARWNGIDPLAENFTSVSPYNFAFNNPVKNLDVAGAAPMTMIEGQAYVKAQMKRGYAAYYNRLASSLYGEPAWVSSYNSSIRTEYANHIKDLYEYQGKTSSYKNPMSFGDPNLSPAQNLGRMLLKVTPIFGPTMSAIDNIRSGNYGGALVDLAFAGTELTSLVSLIKPKYAWRSLTKANAITLDAGNGIFGKAPSGTWTLEQHLIHGSNAKSFLNDPWIATSLDRDVAWAFNGGNGFVRIDLSKVPYSSIQMGWETLPRTSPGYHYSIWQQEVSIYGHVPPSAIKIIY